MDQDIFDDEFMQESIMEQIQLKPKLTLLNQTNSPEFLRKLLMDIDNISMSTLDENFKLPNSKNVNKKVCAKLLRQGEYIVQCFDCRFDRTCVICYQCFKNGDHEGHKYVIRKATAGCCDCGDKQAWKESGFCKNHSGKFRQFSIDKNILSIARQKLHSLLYLYFYSRIQDKGKRKLPYIILSFLLTLNRDNPYYNKITSMCLCEKLMYPLTEQLDKKTSLENILKFDISLMYIDEWFDLFMTLFAYYPFKMNLLKCYIQNYGDLVDGSDQSFKCASSIACQILSSHELIENYSKQNNIGIGQNQPRVTLSSLHDVKKFKRYYLRLFYDLKYINELTKNTASLAYWKMHIMNTKNSIDNIFMYYEEICKLVQIYKNNGISATAQLVNCMQLVIIQDEAITTFTNILKIIKNQKQILIFLLNYFFKKLQTKSYKNSNSICIFRTYQRCLSLTLFTLFQSNLQLLSSNNSKIKQIYQTSSSPQQNFHKLCLQILNKMVTTYILYPKTISLTGLGQSLNSYLLLYKIRYHLLSSIDIICIKMFILFCQNPCQIFNQIFTQIERIVNQGKFSTEDLIYFSSILNFLKYLYVHRVSQIHISCQIDQNIKRYHEELSNLLFGFFYENKGVVSQQKMMVFKNKLFTEKLVFVDDWLRENCTLNKDKKQFVLNKEMYNQNQQTLNLSDFWERDLAESASFANPFKTASFIDKQNMIIFNKIWSMSTIEKLSSCIKCIYQQQSYIQIQQKGIEQILQNVLHIYLIKRDNKDQLVSKYIKDTILMKWIDKIPLQIRQKFDQFKIQKKKEQSNEQDQKAKKKKRMQQIKQKKLQKIKQSQNKFLIQNQMQQQPLLLNKKTTSHNSITSQQIEENEHFCCICRNNKKQNLRYLIRVEITNHDKNLKLGQGLECISYHSCSHTFDYDCIKNLYKPDNMQRSIQCPLCKTWAQVILPIAYQPDNITNEECQTLVIRIILLSIVFQQYQDEQTGIGEILNSLYYYMQMCYVDKKYRCHKNAVIYKTFLQILMRFLEVKRLKQEKIFQKQHKQLYSELKNLRKSTNNKKKLVKKYHKQTKTNLQNQKQVENMVPLFQITMKQLTKIIFTKYGEIKEEIKQQYDQLENQYPQLTHFVRTCFKFMQQENLSSEQKLFLENFDQYKQTKILKQLPNKYSDIASKKLCSQCSQIRPEMTLCLLCHWIGCGCQKGKVQDHHSDLHGGVGVYMQIQSSFAFYYSKIYGKCYIGQLYEDSWNNKVYRNTKWQQFELNKNMVKDIEDTLKYSKPIKKNKKTQ